MFSKLLYIIGFCVLVSGTGKTLDFDYFSLEAPEHWTYIPQRGYDSFVGNLDMGSGNVLVFDYGPYSSSFANLSKNHEFYYDTIANLKAKICVPKKAGSGVTGVYFENVSTKYSGVMLTIVGDNLTPQNHKAFLEAIKTLKFKEFD